MPVIAHKGQRSKLKNRQEPRVYICPLRPKYYEGQTFQADVAENVTNAAGAVVIPKGSEAELIIRKVASPGAVTGTSELALDLQSIKVGGRRYTISTTDVEQKGREGLGTNKRTAEMVGGGAVLGTLIGAIAGGGKGAAIGGRRRCCGWGWGRGSDPRQSGRRSGR